MNGLLGSAVLSIYIYIFMYIYIYLNSDEDTIPDNIKGICENSAVSTDVQERKKKKDKRQRREKETASKGALYIEE